MRGIAKGESSVWLARELGLGRKRVMHWRQRIQNNLYETLPTQRMDGQTFEANELYQNAGEKARCIRTRSTRHAIGPTKNGDAARRSMTAHPSYRLSVERGEVRYWVCEHANKASTRCIIRAAIPPHSTLLFTEKATNYTGLHPQHATVCHWQREWVRDNDGAALHSFLRVFRGGRKYYLAENVATLETLFNAKAISSAVVQAICFA